MTLVGDPLLLLQGDHVYGPNVHDDPLADEHRYYRPAGGLSGLVYVITTEPQLVAGRDTARKLVALQARIANTVPIYVGDSPQAASEQQAGWELTPGGILIFDGREFNGDLYATTAAGGVSRLLVFNPTAG